MRVRRSTAEGDRIIPRGNQNNASRREANLKKNEKININWFLTEDANPVGHTCTLTAPKRMQRASSARSDSSCGSYTASLVATFPGARAPLMLTQDAVSKCHTKTVIGDQRSYLDLSYDTPAEFKKDIVHLKIKECCQQSL